MTNLTKDFIVAMNYAHDYGHYNPRDKQMKLKAYKEFGKHADKILGDTAPNGLTGVWWDEIKQFVDKGIIDWSWTKKLKVKTCNCGNPTMSESDFCQECL